MQRITAIAICLILLLSDAAVATPDVATQGVGAAKMLDMNKNQDRTAYRRQIIKTLRKLQNHYKLIECEFKHGKSPDITLLATHNKASLDVPGSYWDYGWCRTLSFPAKFAWFINMREQKRSLIKPWWTKGGKELAKDYTVSRWVIHTGQAVLERHNILHVWRSPKVDNTFTLRYHNAYLPLPLVSPANINLALKKLEITHGAENLATALTLAKLIDKGNDPDCVADFIDLIKYYGYKHVENATRKVAKMKLQTPKRNIRYLVGILKSEKKKAQKKNKQ